MKTYKLSQKFMEDILEKVHKAGLKFLDPLTPEDTYSNIVKEAIKLMGADYGTLTLEEKGGFKQVYNTLPFKVKRRKKGFTYKAFNESKVLVIYPKENREFLKAHPEFSSSDIETTLDIPLVYKKRSIGVLIVNFRVKKEVTKELFDALLIYGSLACLAIRKTQLYSEVKAALESRDQFIPLAAHELRTPLTSISGYTQLLYGRLSGKNSIESKWIAELLRETHRLTNLVNELVEISRLDAGYATFNFKECNLEVIVKEVIEQFKKQNPDREVVFKSKLILEKNKIIGDIDKLKMTINHLFDNASKFSPNHKKIEVTLVDKLKCFSLSVKDYGDGIGSEDLTKVLNGFYKGKHLDVSGIGLGLYLTKSIIEKHNGSIDISSRLHKGTKVTLKLPKVRL